MHLHRKPDWVDNRKACHCFCVEFCGCECLKDGLVVETRTDPWNKIPVGEERKCEPMEKLVKETLGRL